MARGIKSSVSALTRKRCLVISQNGDGESLQNILTELGLESLYSGTGLEGVTAIQRYNPGVVILFFHDGNEEDTIALRSIEALCQWGQSSAVAMVVSSNVQVVKRLLGQVAKNGRCRVLPDSSPEQLRAVMTDLSKEAQRPLEAARA